jgi:hypothetical protein
MEQMKFFIATSTEIPKKGMKNYLCRKFTTNPEVKINCFMGRVNFTLKLWSSDRWRRRHLFCPTSEKITKNTSIF